LFWDSFKSAVHENTTLSLVEKFNYLISLLEGTASRTIQGLTLTEANYHSAIELLKERFGQPQQIISAHMDELLKIKVCNDSDRFTSLQYMCMTRKLFMFEVWRLLEWIPNSMAVYLYLL
jgi:hypothetical protein